MDKVKIGWTPAPQYCVTNPLQLWKLTAFFEPEPMVAYAAKNLTKDYEFARCPAVATFFRNAFLIRSPVDLSLQFDVQGQKYTVEPEQQAYAENNVWIRWHDFKPGNSLTVTIKNEYLFVADESVLLESTGLPLRNTELLNAVDPIPGAFDIHQWPRPVDFTFIVRNHTQPLVIKRGDPLFMVRFVTKDNAPVELVRIKWTPEIRDIVVALVDTKGFVANASLESRYIQAKNYLGLIKWFN